MAVSTQEVYDMLKSIDAGIKTLIAMGRERAPKEIASDSDLDGQWGDPVVKSRDPRDWTGDPQMGKPFSECPAAYLDLVASRLDFFAESNEAENKKSDKGKPLAAYNRRDAARARGWAARIRNGWKPQPKAEASAFPSDAPKDEPLTDDQIPF